MDIYEFPDYICHYGVKRRSGRYKWGSGEDPYQHEDWMKKVNDLRASGKSEKEIAEQMGLSTTEYRIMYRVYSHQKREELRAKAKELEKEGLSKQAIADKIGLPNESSVRSLLNEDTAYMKNKGVQTADVLEKLVKEKGMIDTGKGVELELGVSKNTLDEALFIMQLRGYNVYGIGVQQGSSKGKQTTVMTLTKPDISYHDAYQNIKDIGTVGEYHSKDGGQTFDKIQYPSSINSDRVSIKYGDEGGTAKDGVIEIRRGVADLDLGPSNYAQVRIMVDGTHYLKGMAMYSDNIPEGKDIVFNTNKASGTPKEKVFKAIKEDPSNPFGALIKANGQSTYIGPDGKEHLSAINKLKEEGDWDEMSRNLSSQFLSKQPQRLIQKQLNLTYANAEDQYNDIMMINNPVVKKKMLLEFANECDAAAVHLKAASLPRQATKVILPVDSLSETEVYAPTLKNGETVALVRFPHGGTFEIPILKVNNNNKSAKYSITPSAVDAVGINSKVAERLSGADFDGDTVVMIPLSDSVRIKSTKPLEGLIGYDAKTEYAYSDDQIEAYKISQKIKKLKSDGKTYSDIAEELGYSSEKEVRNAIRAAKDIKIMSDEVKGRHMGVISNLITDMTLAGADEKELARAVRHSQTVIDAPKHKLNYVQSELDNGIEELKRKYQSHVDDNGVVVYGGASTLLSKRKQDVQVPERQGSGRIDPETGKMVYKTSGREYVDKNGKTVQATTAVKRILSVDDVHSLSSGTSQEEAYADYSNQMKALGNKARLSYLNTTESLYNKEAKEEYAKEYADLKIKLNTALLNVPRERQANTIAAGQLKEFMAKQEEDGVKVSNKDKSKKYSQLLRDARIEVGASGKDSRIYITDREWEAIQKGAISDTTLTSILRFADDERVKSLSMPRNENKLPSSKVALIKSMTKMGYTLEEIAQRVDASPSTVSKYILGKKGE